MAGKHFLDPQAKSTTTTGSKPKVDSLKKANEPQQKKRRSAGRIISNILTSVGVILLLVAVGIFGYNQYQYMKQDQAMEKLASFNLDKASVDKPDENKPPKIDWAGLKKVNKDIVGWIEVPGTVIDYPVFQAQDNEHYLHTLPDGSYGVGGSIFLDSANKKPGMIDQQTILYGHHLKNGAMFKRIADMDNQDMFDSVPLVWYATEDKVYELQPLFVYRTTPDDLDVCIYNWQNEKQFHNYLRERSEKAHAKTKDLDAKINNVKHVLTLSTCNYYDGSGRTELVCAVKSEIVSDK